MRTLSSSDFQTGHPSALMTCSNNSTWTSTESEPTTSRAPAGKFKGPFFGVGLGRFFRPSHCRTSSWYALVGVCAAPTASRTTPTAACTITAICTITAGAVLLCMGFTCEFTVQPHSPRPINRISAIFQQPGIGYNAIPKVPQLNCFFKEASDIASKFILYLCVEHPLAITGQAQGKFASLSDLVG